MNKYTPIVSTVEAIQVPDPTDLEAFGHFTGQVIVAGIAKGVEVRTDPNGLVTVFVGFVGARGQTLTIGSWIVKSADSPARTMSDETFTAQFKRDDAEAAMLDGYLSVETGTADMDQPVKG